MVNVPLSRGAYERAVGREPPLRLVNRYFEENPSNQEDGVALIRRPATASLVNVGDGPIRAMYTLKGLFDDALFVVSGKTLYRVTTDLNVITILGTIAGTGFPRMVGRADSAADRLFICDGGNLYYYEGGETAASSTLTLTGNASAGETVTIGSKTYDFVTALDSAGGSANEVLIGASASASIANLIAAVNGTEGEGFTYGTGTTASTQVTATDGSGDTMDITAIVAGTGGNSIATTETMTNGSWSGVRMAGGADGSLNTITTPDSVGIVSIDVLAQHVLCVVANSQRFYWIIPGAVVIDPLNFAEAEEQPDELNAVRVVDDVAWMLGEAASEMWYANPSATNTSERFIRQQGVAFSRGIIEGTDVELDGKLFVVGDDRVVYLIDGGFRAISTPYVSEKIRTALGAQ